MFIYISLFLILLSIQYINATETIIVVEQPACTTRINGCHETQDYTGVTIFSVLFWIVFLYFCILCCCSDSRMYKSLPMRKQKQQSVAEEDY